MFSTNNRLQRLEQFCLLSTEMYKKNT